MKKMIDIPDNYEPVEEEEYMNPMQLEYFKKKLLSWKAELNAEIDESIQALSTEYDKKADLTDVVTDELNKSFELRIKERHKKLIDKIDEALNRIQLNEYGYCIETGEEIGIKRLMARPIATLCIEAQERREVMEKQYLDEDN